MERTPGVPISARILREVWEVVTRMPTATQAEIAAHVNRSQTSAGRALQALHQLGYIDSPRRNRRVVQPFDPAVTLYVPTPTGEETTTPCSHDQAPATAKVCPDCGRWIWR